MADISGLRALVANISPSNLGAVIAIFAYQGFNPIMVLTHFATIKSDKQIPDDVFVDDLTTLICLGCIVGNYTPKNKDKRDEKGTAKADELFSKYNLTMGDVKNNKRAITLPRVLLSYPILTHKVSLLCPVRDFPGAFSTSSLPQVMKTPIFPALIPRSFGARSTNTLLMAYTCYSCDQSKEINSDMKTMSVVECFNKQLGYVKIGNSSPEPPEKDRESNWKEVIPILIANWQEIVSVLRLYKSVVNPSYVIPKNFGSALTLDVTAPTTSASEGGFE